MTASYRLQHTPGHALTLYTLWQDQQQLGEIRHHDMHAAVLYLGERGFWLRHDEGAAAKASGANLLRRMYLELKFTRSWSLHDGQSLLARAQRRWDWRPSHDMLLLWPAPDATPLQAASPGISRRMTISSQLGTVGRLHIEGWLREHVQLEGIDLDPARAALFMYAMHRAYGSTSSEGGE